MIYLDYNATTPLCPEAVTAIKTLLDDPTSFGNPSSNHSFGEAAHRVVETARARVAGLLNCESNEIIFTSGGTESNNLALVGAARANKHRGRHIITTSIEHPAVANVLSALVHEGFAVTTLPVDVYGRLSPKTLQDALAAHPDTILVSVMHSNNEVGTVQPIAELAKLARAGGALFHTDAAQSIGKVPVDVRALGVDLLSLAAHKLYSPKGVGALFIRQGVVIEPFMRGASHEGGRRPGTENVLLIAALGASCEMLRERLAGVSAHCRRMRNLLWSLVDAGINADSATPRVVVNGPPLPRFCNCTNPPTTCFCSGPCNCTGCGAVRDGSQPLVMGLPNTLNIGVLGVNASDVLAKLREHGIACSAGAACHGTEVKISGVLSAMGVPYSAAAGAIRLSTGLFVTEAEIRQAGAAIVAVIRELQTRTSKL
eukprot:TRINITY_DN3203_c0_g1_i1.p1 TRINITY_DN3203_c0_g1~~TRINITY_DN3203_c0_g1_i1.p1  ORF type:complete len:428 (-),score=83.70 TRINITY_DN3203_c0_g1_i1:702-1985(-)